MRVCLNLVQVSFNKQIYKWNEDKGLACPNLKLNEPAPTDITVTITNVDYTTTGELTYAYLYVRTYYTTMVGGKIANIMYSCTYNLC